MPFLHKGALVGRFDLKTLRDEALLHVKASYAEPDIEPGRIAEAAYAELMRLAQFVGAEGLRVERRGNLAVTLRKIVSGSR